MQLLHTYACLCSQTKWFGVHFLCGLASRVRVSLHHAAGRRVVPPSCAHLLRRGVWIRFGHFAPAGDTERPTARDHRGCWEAAEKTVNQRPARANGQSWTMMTMTVQFQPLPVSQVAFSRADSVKLLAVMGCHGHGAVKNNLAVLLQHGTTLM